MGRPVAQDRNHHAKQEGYLVMYSLLGHLEREQELLGNIKTIDTEIQKHKLELRRLEEDKKIEENKLSQIRGFIKNYLNEVKELPN